VTSPPLSRDAHNTLEKQRRPYGTTEYNGNVRLCYGIAMEYFSIPVPEPLVAPVLCAIADYLKEAGEYSPQDPQLLWTSSTPLQVHASWDRVASEHEGLGAQNWWNSWLRPTERELLKVLASAPGHRMAAPDTAALLDMSSQALAGVIGPFNRRLRRDGFPPAIDSQLETTDDGTRRRVTHLGIGPGLAQIVDWYRDAPITVGPPRATVKVPPTAQQTARRTRVK
jgi:hypothetical protein